MPQIIATNVPSLNAQNNLAKSQSSLNTSLTRLSSGLRINSAKDDAAGLSIVEKFTSQIRGLSQAARNANDGISVAQVAEGAMQEQSNILQRMRELSVQSVNGSNGTDERTALDNEFQALIEELDRVSSQTKFGDKALLDGTFSSAFQVGANAGETISVSIGGTSASDLSVNSLDISTSGGASAAIAAVDSAITSLASSRSELGAVQNRFESTISNLNNIIENVSAARSRIRDADFAAETSNLTKQSILQQSGISVLAQANALPQQTLALLG
jgi:flagellin